MADPTDTDAVAANAGILAAKYGDPMRLVARPLSPEAAGSISLVKGLATMLYAAVAELPRSRERALSLTKIEESVMWATKAATANEGKT